MVGRALEPERPGPMAYPALLPAVRPGVDCFNFYMSQLPYLKTGIVIHCPEGGEEVVRWEGG